MNFNGLLNFMFFCGYIHVILKMIFFIQLLIYMRAPSEFFLNSPNLIKLKYFFFWKIGMKTKYQACWRKNNLNLSWCRILYTKNYQSSLKVEDTLYLCISPLIIRSIYQKRKHRKPPNIELLYDLWFTLIDTCMCKIKLFFFFFFITKYSSTLRLCIINDV